MTREEALEWFKDRKTMYHLDDKCQQAEDMAIKALEQEPCEDAISRSEAIRVASGYCHWSNIPDELAKLPSVNPIPCEDAISRQAAIDAVRFGVTHAIRINRYTGEKDDLFQASNEELEKAIERIADLPSVSTEKTGHWFAWKPEDDVWRTTCSECGEETRTLWKYCPNCGARMEVEK